MAASYGPLSMWYDTLTGDIPYGGFADFYKALFDSDGGEFKTLLDLCCGTGTLTALMARRGYEMIAASSSDWSFPSPNAPGGRKPDAR